MNSKKILLELVGWLITVVIILLVVLPIVSNVDKTYPFLVDNVLLIIIAITLLRYMFLLKYHWVSSSKWIKVVFVFLPIPIFIYLIDTIYEFQKFCDEVGLPTLFTHLKYNAQVQLSKYVRAEMLLFWSMAFMSVLYLPIRMILSLWRQINKGTH